MESRPTMKTESEKLFSDYLDEEGYEWLYEPEIEGKRKKPDFALCRDDVRCLCDTKERSPNPAPPGARMFDPIKPVRDLIKKGRDKFQEYSDRLCVLVVYNNGDSNTRLDPMTVFGAMLGDPGFTLDFNPQNGTCDPDSVQNTFLERGGSMIRHYSPLEPHKSKTNLSAIAALMPYRVPNAAFDPVFKTECTKQSANLNRDLTRDERLKIRYSLLESIPMTLRSTSRLVVCTNPFASHPLPTNVFNGPFDERWAICNGEMVRVFAGHEISEQDCE